MSYAKFAPRLVELGYDVTPLKGKRPFLDGWQTRPDGALDFQQYKDANIGVVLGGQFNVAAIDIDVYAANVADYIHDLAVERFGGAPCRIGMAPKRMLIVRCSEPWHKVKTSVYSIDGHNGPDNKGNAVEILGEGQQFVASGTHPETGRKYRWPDDSLLDIPAAALPVVSPQDLTAFLNECNNTLAKFGKPMARSLSSGKRIDDDDPFPRDLETTTDKLRPAVEALPNDNLHYDDWIRIGIAIKGAVGEAGLEDWHAWSAKSDKYDPKQTDRAWNSFGTPTNIGAGTIFYHAKEHGYEPPKKPQAEIPPDPAALTPIRDRIRATPLGVIDPKKIPRRPWILKPMLLEGYVSELIAPPGVGKSTLTIQIAIAIAMDKPFAQWSVKTPGKVWLFNNEDDRAELERRITAAAIQMNVSLGDLADALFVDTGAERELVIAKEDKETANVIYTPDVDALIEEIQANNIKVLIVDPFAETHTVNENSNDQIKMVAKMYRRIAQQTKCAILIVHHTRKSPAGDNSSQAGNMDSGRGAGALTGVARVVNTLFNMSKKDAEKCGVPDEDRHLYVRHDDAKANLSLVTNEAVWFKRVSIDIGNHGDELDEEADVVGALEYADLSLSKKAAEQQQKDELRQEATNIAAWMYENGYDEASLYKIQKEMFGGNYTGYRLAEAAIPEASQSALECTFNGDVHRCYRFTKNNKDQTKMVRLERLP